ncbi:hypothetical protein AeMF1_008425, partial [Aphanomyces euteiches]
KARQFHPVAFYVLGREAEPDYSWAIRELMTIYAVVVGEPLRISYVMSDAARAPALAIQLVKEDLGVEKTLMCFYHCMANVHKFLSGVSIAAKSLAFRHIYNMHYSRSEDEMQYHWGVAQESWLRYQELGRFVDYFRNQWIDSGSSCWQVYHAPSGFPTTNNPCEAFNKIFKDVYTKRQKHGLCATFEMLGDMAEAYSTFKAIAFVTHSIPSIKLQRRTKRLMDTGLLELVESPFDLPPGEVLVRSVVPGRASSLAYSYQYRLLGSTADEAQEASNEVVMTGSEADRVDAYYYNANTNNVKHEIVCDGNDQPSYGWRICTLPGSIMCECNYFFKNAFCCHVLCALKLQQRDFLGYPLPERRFQPFADRRQRASERRTQRRRGRARSRVAPALVVD